MLPPQTPIATVISATGGVLVATGNLTATITFPAGAVSQPVTITFSFTNTGSNGTNLTPVGAGFVLEAYAADGVAITHFAQPISIAVQYSDADVMVLDEMALKLFYWDMVTASWMTIPTIVDSAANTLSATLAHFTRFGVFAPSPYRVFLPLLLSPPNALLVSVAPIPSCVWSTVADSCLIAPTGTPQQALHRMRKPHHKIELAPGVTAISTRPP